MTLLLKVLAVLVSLAAGLSLAGAAPAAADTAPPAQLAATADSQSVYCVYVGPARIGHRQLYPGGTYCVPAP